VTEHRDPEPSLLQVGAGVVVVVVRNAAGATGRSAGVVAPGYDAAAGLARRALRMTPVPVRSQLETWQGHAGKAGEQALRNVRAAVERLLDTLVPAVTNAILDRLDLTRIVIDRVDVDAVVATADLDAAARRIDVDAVAARLDVEAVVRRLDLTRIVTELVDLQAVIAAVDLDAVIATVDLDAAAARIDVDAVANRIDLDAIASRIDVDAVAARLDVDAVIDRIDLVSIAEEVISAIDLPEIIRESSGSVASETVRGLRMQGIAGDEAVGRIVDRVIRRRRTRETQAPQRDAAGADLFPTQQGSSERPR
jgi:hypothetical protein